MKKTVLLLLLVIGALLLIKNEWPNMEASDLSVAANAIHLLNVETGEVLYTWNHKEALPIASMSKLMTQYLVLNAIQNGSLSWESTYSPSAYVLKLMDKSSASKLGMVEGESYTVRELFTAMTVSSANDAAMGLAELVSGTEDAFVTLMNEQAAIFNLKETRFFNASGLDGDYLGKSIDETNIASARDVAALAQRLLERHPHVLDFSRLPSFETSMGIRLWNTNLMLPGMSQAFEGIDGLKTGFTDAAGSCFVSTGMFNGDRYIIVVMDVDRQGEDTTIPRFILTKELIERYIKS